MSNNLYKSISLISLLLINGFAAAYVPNMGGSGGGGACAKPKFSHFNPVAKAEMSPGTEFSFIASPNTHPNSIKVTVKGIPVALMMGPKNENAFKVSGVLPESLKNTFARISIVGKSSGNCENTDGWLVKITE